MMQLLISSPIRTRKALREYPEVSFKAEEMSGGIFLTFSARVTAISESLSS